jgi:hypothetical protein
MPVHAWRPRLRLQHEGKSWMPTFVGMTLGALHRRGASHRCARRTGGAE